MSGSQYEHTQTVLESIKLIESMPDKFGVFDVVLSLAESFGFHTATVGQLIHPSLNNIDYADLGVSNFPSCFQEVYVSKNYILHDPVIIRAIEVSEPFKWRDTYDQASKRGRIILDESRKAGLLEGLAIPIRIENRTPGIASFAAEKINLTPADIHALELVSIHAYTKMLDLFEKGHDFNKVKLTSREIDVLHHVARGQTDHDIASELNLSHHSIKDHITNARKKLGAKTRANCVMIALRDGHIKL